MTENFKAFLDSNVWLYALTDEDEKRGGQAENLIEAIGGARASSARRL